MASSSPEYTLHYFGTFGRGEPIRMFFRYFEIPYTEKTYNLEEWMAKKNDPMFEFKQMPMLQTGGKNLVQSVSILRYLSQKRSAYPTDPVEIALLESIVELRYEIYDQVMPFMYQMQVDNAKNWYRENMKRYFPTIEALLTANSAGQGKFFVGAKVSMADFIMFELGYSAFLRPGMDDLGTAFRSQAPKFFAFLDSFKVTKPAFAQYVNTEKAYPF